MSEVEIIETDDDGIEAEEEEELAVPSLSRFRKDVDNLAVFYIDKFFEGREMHYGGPISVATLHSPAYVQMVQELDIDRGVKRAYDLIERSQQMNIEVDEHNVSEDVCVVVDTLQECARRGIPKCFASGILMMYLELCKGIKLPKNLAYSGFGRG